MEEGWWRDGTGVRKLAGDVRRKKALSLLYDTRTSSSNDKATLEVAKTVVSTTPLVWPESRAAASCFSPTD
eukprot:8850584-Pyramimonas_sp.AAC.1